MPESFDLIIIGAGPAGLSAADAAAREGLQYLVIEKGTIADTIRHYPVGRTLFSTSPFGQNLRVVLPSTELLQDATHCLPGKAVC